MPINYTDISKIAPQAFTHHEYKCHCNYCSKSILMEQELDTSKRTNFFWWGKERGKNIQPYFVNLDTFGNLVCINSEKLIKRYQLLGELAASSEREESLILICRKHFGYIVIVMNCIFIGTLVSGQRVGKLTE